MSNSAALRRLGLLLAGSLAPSLLGCTQEPREVPPTDCSIDGAFEFHPLYLPLTPPAEEIDNWYASGDNNARTAATNSLGVTTEIPALGGSQAYDTRAEYLGDAVCGHTIGKHFTFGLNHDYGSVAGRWNPLGGADVDASEYEGFAFWGLSLYDRSIELNWSDIHSASPPAGETDFEKTCIPDVLPDSSTNETNPDYVDSNGVPKANSCGSLFSRRLIMAKSWTLYTIPFSDFIQVNRDPRFKPSGLTTSEMRQFSFRVPKDTFVDVSFVNFAWYRKASN